MLSKSQCQKVIEDYLGSGVEFEMNPGLPPEPVYVYWEQQPVWSAFVPEGNRVGGSRYVIVSGESGRILCDGCYGE